MRPSVLIPVLWLRLVVVILFAIWLLTQHLWLIAAVAVALAGLSVWQLATAYRNR